MSVTTAGLTPAPTEHLLDGVLLAVLTHTPGASVGWTFDGGVLEVTSEGDLEIRLSVPLKDAVGFWHPDCRWVRTLPADWAGWAHASLVKGAVAGCLYDSHGETMLAYLAEDPVPETIVRFGVSEENQTFVVHLGIPAGASPYRLLVEPRSRSVATAMRTLRGRLRLGLGLAPVQENARVPVYSTWYGFSQRVDAASVEAEAELAAEAGCGVLIMDDGWQRFGNGRGYAGVGDWLPDETKFPDFAGHVAKIQGMGLKYLAWVAPLLVGPEAECFGALEPFGPLTSRPPGARVLDPRRPEVRAHVVKVCAKLIADYGLDGLKIDFLDDAMAYAGQPGEGLDVADVGAAMRLMLDDLLHALGPEVLIGLRQPYIGPGMAAYGEMLRADDCPADATANRVQTIDAGLLAVRGAVHGDMLMWDEAATPVSAARQIIASLHAVPQISARLTRLDAEQRGMVAFWLGQWRRLRHLFLDGEVEPGRPDELYPVIVAAREDECAITVSADHVVPVDTARFRTFTLINATAAGRLVLEIRGGPATVRTQIFDACGRIIDRSELRLEPGLCALEVPPSGLAILEGSP
ncbi:alpha-galactosidase [Nonomuraea sp. WAC 01424]|uniref:glycoside hydrolase family 36 protein n=1 Tax=Nonomuraea sp. WAC 01424 TaxID=2203200 RepID=UPI000F7B9DDB|nr:glycoside hydrolase family 36 protein [Nonomuraea sp. WAC 01424]RSM93671.1 alpha-galactosidase [Nonomuraea sp. WAC 01424]